ncbi:MAG TPA: hypothetical protein VN578_14795 [Candidatus Binatia bacterium]|jgi:hypothetical protein|nr:hypothetical protein [Candidatus Binatia bacterium]
MIKPSTPPALCELEKVEGPAPGMLNPPGQTRALVRTGDLIGSAEFLLVTLAATLIPVSLLWDFSWESTIGVDRFWSPPHLATHIGVWLSGLLAVRLIFVFTAARRQDGALAGVHIGPLCGPAGVWILFWAAATLQAALLLDNWWQRAYGLGAGLWHPPQILKAVGFFALLFGGVMLGAGNLSKVSARTGAGAAFLAWHGGLLLTMCALVLMMTNYPNLQHTATFYLVSSAIYPAVLLGVGRPSHPRWGATGVALVYTAILGAMVWLLPRFPAHPLTPPIHNPADHMMPPPFPLLLVLPALVLDRLVARPVAGRSFLGQLLLAGAAGVAFLATFLPSQWFFARFLLSPAADNWFFAGGGRHWPFFLKIDQARIMFWGMKQDPLTFGMALLAALAAAASAWIGLRVAAWLTGLRR